MSDRVKAHILFYSLWYAIPAFVFWDLLWPDFWNYEPLYRFLYLGWTVLMVMLAEDFSRFLEEDET
jgi:hypothetical protein